MRTDNFHVEESLPFNKRVHPGLYIHSGYDKGHMVPADTATTITSMYDTFSMANMTPQEPKLNRGRWKQLEQRIQKEIEGPINVVVTGVILADRPDTMSGIAIPSGYYKIHYKPSGTTYWYTSNTPTGEVKQVTKMQLRSLGAPIK